MCLSSSLWLETQLGDEGQGESRLSFTPRLGGRDPLHPLKRKMTNIEASIHFKPILSIIFPSFSPEGSPKRPSRQTPSGLLAEQ